MSRGGFRGRGWRGHGGQFRGFGNAPPVPYENFPENVNLPELPEIAVFDPELNKKKVLDDLREHVERATKFDEFWRTSCYYLEPNASRKCMDEGVSLKNATTPAKREAFALYLNLTTLNFPAELVQGTRVMQRSTKKLRWDRESDMQAIKMLERLEETSEGKGKKSQDDKDEEDEELEEEMEDDEDEDEYKQNEYFDDDEDDMNQEEEEEEDVYND